MFVLARDLGMTVADLGRRMSSAEFTDWIAFYKLEQDDRKAAMRDARAKAAAKGAKRAARRKG